VSRTQTTDAWIPCGGLVLLALRRLFTRSFLFAAVILAALWLSLDLSISEATQTADAALLRSTRRESTWVLFAVCLLPVCIYGAARVGERWFGGDRDWIGARAISRARFALSTWTGLWLAATLVTLSIGALGEFMASGDGASARRLAGLAAPSRLLAEDDASTSWVLDESQASLAEGRRLRLELHATPGDGPTAGVRFSARRSATGEVSATEAIVSGRTRVELALPSGTGELELTLEKLGRGCGIVVLSDSLALFEPIASERSASVAVFMHALFWLGGWLAIAMGLGTRMHASTATALTLVLQLPLWSAASSSSTEARATFAGLLPGSELPQALALLGDGLALSMPAHTTLFGFAVLVTIGLRLTVTGLNRGGVS